MSDVSDGELLALARGELSPEERRRLEQRLDESPADGEVLARLVQMFGDVDETGHSVLGDTSPGAYDVEGDRPNLPRVGSRVGRYLVIEELGAGGMGVVFRAYDPKLQREVALKCLRPGLLSSELQARLVREAQAMAKLSHRNVVSVYDVELLEHELVLVMEYVQGTHLGRWLDDRPRAWREVIAVFVAAGEGLAAAHAVGVLHRDFKPANVLLAAAGDVKVTDFGVAAMDDASGSLPPSLASLPPGSLEEESLHDGGPLTEIGQVMGTPLYMPPEQLSGQSLTAAADQYAFCVSLWQGLTGAPPFTVEAGGNMVELLQRKAAGPPRWPASAAGVPRRFAEAIARGLHPDPAARWPSMTALLAELRSDPRAARRRTAIGAIVALGALAGFGGDAWSDARAVAACEAEGAAIDAVWSAARADAIAASFRDTGLGYAEDTWHRAIPKLDAFAAGWRQARTQACLRGEVDETLEPRRLARVRACLDERRGFLESFVGELAEPDETIVARATLATWSLPSIDACLDEAELDRTGAELDDPALQAEVQALARRLADAAAQEQAGRYGEALAAADAALQHTLALDPPRLVAAAHLSRGEILFDLGRYEEAEDALESAYAEAVIAGEDDRAHRAANLLAFTLGDRLARPQEAERWAWLARLSRTRLGLPDTHPDAAAALNTEAAIQWSKGELREALARYRQALEVREDALGRDHPEVAVMLGNIGSLLLELGEYEEARVIMRRALAVHEAALGPDHPELAQTLNNLGNALMVAGEHEEALVVHRRALALREATLPPDHPDLAVSLGSIGIAHAQRGEHAQALAAHQRSLAILERALPPDHPDLASTLNNLSNAYQALGRHDEALAMQERSLAILERVRGPEHLDVAMSLNNLGSIHIERGAHAEALPVLQRALALWERALGPEHPYVATALLNLGDVRHAQGAHEEALGMHQRALAIWEASLEPHHAYVATARLHLGLDLLALERPAEAVAPLERALDDLSRGSGSPAELGEARFALARALWEGGGDRGRAGALAWQALDDRRALPRPPASLRDLPAWIERHAVPRPATVSAPSPGSRASG